MAEDFLVDPERQKRNLALFEYLRTPDPAYTKQFKRSGGFSGTAINPTWIAARMTAAFGPCGLGWGIEIEDERYVEGHVLDPQTGTKAIVHVLRVAVWYIPPKTTTKCVVRHFGQTTFVGKNQHGLFTDEEAPKKSLTDGFTKAASLIGVAADVHLGLFDDNKYVSQAEATWEDNRIADAPHGAVPPPTAAELNNAWAALKQRIEGADLPTLRALRPEIAALADKARRYGHEHLIESIKATANEALARATAAAQLAAQATTTQTAE